MQEAGNYMQLNVGELLTSGAIIVALVTWWLTFQQARRSEKISRTAEVIANLSVSETLAEATYQVTRLINDGRRLAYASLDDPTERNVVKILDYYEYMCELYESGILSKRTIVTLRGQLMIRTYDACEDYIMETRNRQGRQVYEAFERFVSDLRVKADNTQPKAVASASISGLPPGPPEVPRDTGLLLPGDVSVEQQSSGTGAEHSM